MKDKIIITTEAGERLDSFLARHYPDYSRSYFADLIKNSSVFVNSRSIKPSYILKINDEVEIEIKERESKKELIPENIELNILYEDENVLVINKQAGLTVHPGAGNETGTLVNALINHFPKIREAVFEKGHPISEARPGIVHRLDKDTSGVMIVAKNDRAMHSLAKQIQNRTVKKSYLALLYGWPKAERGQLVNFLGRHPVNRKIVSEVGEDKGKKAVSDYEVKKTFLFRNEKLSLVEFLIHTGRTHQIRVQSKLIGNPVLGDLIYGNKSSQHLSSLLGVERQLLHSYKLSITLPGENKARDFTASLPPDFSQTMDKLQQVD